MYFLWDRAIFVLDANILLHVYEFNLNDSEELVKSLTHLGRIWIPHQFYDEYRNNQFKVRQRMIERQYSAGEDPEVIRDCLAYDRLAYEMNQLFSESIGQPYPESRKEELCAQAKNRHEQGIPPGHNDNGRPGDYIGWRQTIDYAKEKKLPVIMVTDDRGWFEKSKQYERTHPDLIKEIHDEAGVEFHLYTYKRFISFIHPYQRHQELVKYLGEFIRRLNYPKIFPDLGKSAIFSSLPAVQPIFDRESLATFTAINPDFKNIGLSAQKTIQSINEGASAFAKRITDLHTPIPINRRLDEILNKSYMQTGFLDTFMPEIARRNMESIIAEDVARRQELLSLRFMAEQDAQNRKILAGLAPQISGFPTDDDGGSIIDDDDDMVDDNGDDDST